MDSKINDSNLMCEQATELFNAGSYDAAAELFLILTEDDLYAPYAFYMLANISNRMGDPLIAKELYYKALTLSPSLYKNLLPPDHPNYDYVFRGIKQFPTTEACPICGKSGEPIWCYATARYKQKHAQNYNPVLLWMYCDKCHHVYTNEFPEHEISDPGSNIQSVRTFPTEPTLFPYYSRILSKLATYTSGTELLEVGLGGCECALVAREMGYNVFGIDIAESCLSTAKKYGIEAESHDFIDFKTDRKWDVIIFGDVIEHVSDPVAALEKLNALLNDDGVLWLSTPNFDSAYSIYYDHFDPMRIEVTHKNYFSRTSLLIILEQCRFKPVDYLVSDHYEGSMEVICVKMV